MVEREGESGVEVAVAVATIGERPPRSLRSRAAHAGEDGGRSSGPHVEPIHQSAVYAFADAEAAGMAYAKGDPLYARDGLPNVRALERAVADLEGAEDAQAVSSGMAAIALSLTSLLTAGDHVVAPACGYCDTSALLEELLVRFGIRVTFADYHDAANVEAAIEARTRIVFAETISNPGMELADLPALAAIAHRNGVLLLVDNTFATPLLCRPLEHGADLVLHSAGKFLGGHSDVTAGVVAGREDLIATMRRHAYLTGPTLAP
ncbi:MAG TPA: aminotransferase class I/II-fold pyridoxal phosphate-dependent enzyme, partial [Thermomicrobiales bacterium]|nr:aminotransferase class I/II-fold pyridoxal phosphate-dependent enzyme [Thermomicrobiales bacterium]